MIGQALYQMTFGLDMTQKICLRSYSRHDLIHLDAFRDFHRCFSGRLHGFCGELLVLSIKYNFGIVFAMANYVMWTTGIVHCKGQAWSSQLGQGTAVDSLLWNFMQFWWSLYQ